MSDSKTVQRFDRARFRSIRMENGYLRADAQLTRPGVFTYRAADGSERREYRPPEEVFDDAAVESAKLIPVTNDHPPEMLNVENTRTYSVGKVGENVGVVDGWLQGVIQIEDIHVLSDIQNGKQELSMGYTVTMDETPGLTPDGEPFDAVQRDIRYNHVSVVDRGRVTGSRVLITDAAEQKEKDKPTMKLKIGAVSFDLDEQAIEAIEAERADSRSKLDGLRAERDAEKARADAAEAERDREKARADSAEDPSAVRKAVDARLELERAAVSVLDSDVAKMSDAEIMTAVIKKDCPEAKLDGESDVYLRARFDHVMQNRPVKDGANKVDSVRGAINKADADVFDEDQALAELQKRGQEAWKVGI